MACCGNCEHGTGPCLGAGGRSHLAELPRVGAISTASVAGIPLVATAGAVGGGWGGWALARMVSKRNMALNVLGAAAGAYVGWNVAPKATDAVGL